MSTDTTNEKGQVIWFEGADFSSLDAFEQSVDNLVNRNTMKQQPAILPGQGLAFEEGQLFTTFGDRPEGVLFVVADEAKALLRRLTAADLIYITSPERGEYRGFAALHDLCDANMLLPGADDERFIGENQQWRDTYVDFCNAVMAEFNRIVLA